VSDIVCINTFHGAVFTSAIVGKITFLTGFIKIISFNLFGIYVHSKEGFPCKTLRGTGPLKMC
jgi:hypothetical protein